MIHKTTVENYSGSMEDLAEEIGDLRYDALANFLDLLADKIQRDGEKDQQRQRVKLANSLFQCAEHLKASKAQIERAWEISEPFMK